MFRIIKRYSPYAGGHTSDIVLGMIGGVFLVLSLVFQWPAVRDGNLSGLFFSLCLGAWCYPFGILIFVKLPKGYRLEQDRIVYYCKCRKNELLYRDIPCIIVVNFADARRTIRTPWAAMIGKEEDEIINHIMNDKKRHVLTSREVQCTLGEKIGYWHEGVVWKFFEKGSWKTYDYGFYWNKKEMHKVLEGFEGDYYIAASVLHNHEEEFHAVCETYGISRQRIHIIDDTVNGEFIW